MRQILAGLGRFWFGRVIADDFSAEGFGPLRWVLWNSDVVRMGVDGRVVASSGPVWIGAARTANGSTEGFGLPYCSFGSRCGAAWRGMARRGTDGRGRAMPGEDCEAQV